MTVSRRQFLRTSSTAGAIGALAGCIGFGSSDPDVADINPGEILNPIELDIRQPGPDNLAVEGSILNGFGEEYTAVIQMTMSNDGEEASEIHGAAAGGFGDEALVTRRADGPEQLIAYPRAVKDEYSVYDDENPSQRVGFPEEPDDGCWQLDGPTVFDWRQAPDDIRSEAFTLEPGDSRDWSYELYFADNTYFPREGTGSDWECPALGTYEYRTQLSDNGFAFFWGFEITIQ